MMVVEICQRYNNVCCDTECNTQCQACVNSKTGDSDGICAAVLNGSDPDSECGDSPPCGPNDTGCNGSANDPHCVGYACSCAEQYTHADIIDDQCGQNNYECELRVSTLNYSCDAICAAGGGECLGFWDDLPAGTCNQGILLACGDIGIASAICICTRGCRDNTGGTDPACVTPFTCQSGDCVL